MENLLGVIDGVRDGVGVSHERDFRDLKSFFVFKILTLRSQILNIPRQSEVATCCGFFLIRVSENEIRLKEFDTQLMAFKCHQFRINTATKGFLFFDMKIVPNFYKSCHLTAQCLRPYTTPSKRCHSDHFSKSLEN